MKTITVRPIRPEEIDQVASLIAKGYEDDIFFKWVVENDDDRQSVVTDYYKGYLSVEGCIANVAETPSKDIIGATVWLPHDVDPSLYDEIDKAAGIYASKFRAVADKSHDSEPPMGPFYQLVGIVVDKAAQGLGVGAQLLDYQLTQFDALGIPTYLEASTPYHGKGVYGKFGYQPVGELMVFDDHAVLYPLWRPALKKQTVTFGNREWRVLETKDDKQLLLCESIVELASYHDTYENVTWSTATSRHYLNETFYETFTAHDQSQIVETNVVASENPWFGTKGGAATIDKIFLLSLEEVVNYLGGNLQQTPDTFYIDDCFNFNRKATLPSRWLLRTPGKTADFVSVVTVDGRISVTGDFVNRKSSDLFKVGIRPAMWVKKG